MILVFSSISIARSTVTEKLSGCVLGGWNTRTPRSVCWTLAAVEVSRPAGNMYRRHPWMMCQSPQLRLHRYIPAST